MSKKSNKGKAYFYARGQRDRYLYCEHSGPCAMYLLIGRNLPMWARNSYCCGFEGI